MIDIPDKVVSRTKIGSGGYGSVFKVTTKLGNVYAEKEMLLFRNDDRKGNLNVRNLREAMFLFKTDPSLCETHIHSSDSLVYQIKPSRIVKKNKRYFIITTMPYFEETLFDYIDRTSFDERMPHFFSVFNQLVNACSLMNQMGYVHTDIKPKNIVVSLETPKDPNNNSTLHLMLVDCGGVHFEINEYTRFTTTSDYGAPENFDRYYQKYNESSISSKKYTPYIESWSVGLTMLEFIVGYNVVGEFEDDYEKIERFICQNEFPVDRILERNDVQVDDKIRTLLKCLLRSKAENRIPLNHSTVYKLSIPQISLSSSKNSNEYDCYETSTIDDERVVFDSIQSERRKKAIQIMFRFIEKSEFNEPKIAFDIALNLTDQYVHTSDGSIIYSTQLLRKFIFIVTCILTDSHENWTDVFFKNEKSKWNQDPRKRLTHNKSIVEIIQWSGFDLYHKGIFSVVSKKYFTSNVLTQTSTLKSVVDLSCVPSDDISEIFRTCCNMDTIDLSLEERYEKFLENIEDLEDF